MTPSTLKDVINRLQILRLGVDGIAEHPEKIDLNRVRAQNASKQIELIAKLIQSEKDCDAHVGAVRD